MKSPRHLVTIVSLIPLAFACASNSQSWEEVRAKDTPGAYHRFLRDNPRAPEVAEARERLMYTRLKQNPSVNGYVEFSKQFPHSQFLPEIQPLIEDTRFNQARARGNVAALKEFVEQFPESRHTSRALGNIDYMVHDGYAGRPRELVAFAKRHPGSDFAADARRSVESIGVRQRSEIRTVGLVIEIAPGTPGGPRLARSFAQRAQRHYARHRVKVVALESSADPRVARVDAVLKVEHAEEPVGASAETSFKPGIVAKTKLTLASGGEVIRSDDFELKVSHSERKDKVSILFGVAGDQYWKDFFLPDATWRNQHAMREALDVKKSGVAVDTDGHRAAVVYADGSFDVVDLADPERPQIAEHYVRSKDLTSWQGIRLIGDRVAIYGNDGLEVFELGDEAPRRIVSLDTAQAGSLVAVESASEGILLAGSRGLTLLERGSNSPRTLIDQPVVGAALSRGRVYFTNGSSLLIASMQQLLRQKAEGQLRIGEKFAPRRVQVFGNVAVVMGETDALLVDVSNPAAPRAGAHINSTGRGEIRDAVVRGGQLYLLTERGLLISNLRDVATDDALDITPRARLASAGRYVVAVGDGNLQVVDTTPFLNAARPASKQR